MISKVSLPCLPSYVRVRGKHGNEKKSKQGTIKEARREEEAQDRSLAKREKGKGREMRAWLFVFLKFQERQGPGSSPRILRN